MSSSGVCSVGKYGRQEVVPGGVVVAVAGYKGRTKGAGSQGDRGHRRQAGRVKRDDGTD